jgi:hypothetical protein
MHVHNNRKAATRHENEAHLIRRPLEVCRREYIRLSTLCRLARGHCSYVNQGGALEFESNERAGDDCHSTSLFAGLV